MPRVDEGSDQWRVDGQEFPALGTQKTASTIIGSVAPGDTGRGPATEGTPGSDSPGGGPGDAAGKD